MPAKRPPISLWRLTGHAQLFMRDCNGSTERARGKPKMATRDRWSFVEDRRLIQLQDKREKNFIAD